MSQRVQRHIGTATVVHRLSPRLVIFRLAPEAGTRFPAYEPGQYIALSRDDSLLTQRVGQDASGAPIFVPTFDEGGYLRRGRVTHAYSIASAPFETDAEGHLEFYVVLEIDSHGLPGRLSAALVQMGPDTSLEVAYLDRVAGTFTLAQRAQGGDHVLMVASGTGVAPFVSMLKQADHLAAGGRGDGRRYTLLYANRTPADLGYHADLRAIEAAGRIDFAYVPTVSRPDDADGADPLAAQAGRGRVHNVLRHLAGLPTLEAERQAAAGDQDAEAARAASARTVDPVLPPHLTLSALRTRLLAPGTVILACGNPVAMADTEIVAARLGIRCESEEW